MTQEELGKKPDVHIWNKKGTTERIRAWRTRTQAGKKQEQWGVMAGRTVEQAVTMAGGGMGRQVVRIEWTDLTT